MQALWIENQNLSLRTVDAPVASGDLALLKIQLAGICGTDLELVRGYYHFVGIPGHEFVAQVISGSTIWAGRRIVVDINFGCGRCSQCKSGSSHHCPKRKVLGIKHHPGAFAEQVVVPASNLLAIPDTMEDRTAVFVEPLAAAMEILEQVRFSTSDRVLIIGAGRLGQLISQVLQREVKDVSICIRSQTRKTQFDPSIRVVHCEEIEQEYDHVVECTGQPSGFELALKAVKPGGHLILKSTYASELAVDMSRIVVNELKLIGSRCGPMQKAIDCLTRGEIDLSGLVIVEHPLEEFESAFRDARDPLINKVMLKP